MLRELPHPRQDSAERILARNARESLPLVFGSGVGLYEPPSARGSQHLD
jgi:hypothetical protein